MHTHGTATVRWLGYAVHIALDKPVNAVFIRPMPVANNTYTKVLYQTKI